jgi:hypothetical protein
MRCVLCGLLLVLVAAVSAQQQQPPNDRHGTPPTFPEGQPPTQAMPPDTEAPPPQQMSSWQVQQHTGARADVAARAVTCRDGENLDKCERAIQEHQRRRSPVVEGEGHVSALWLRHIWH